MRTLAVLHRGLHILAATEEVALGERNLAEEAVRSGVAAAQRELTGGLVFDLDIDDHAIGFRTRLVGDADVLEVAEIAQATGRPFDQRLVVGVAFTKIELATDHIIARAGVAADVDALNIDLRALFHDIVDADDVAASVANGTRADLREGVAGTGQLDRHVLDGLVHVLAAIGPVVPGLDIAIEVGGVDVGNGRFNLRGAEFVILALVDRNGQDVGVLLLVQRRHNRDDTEIGIAMVHVELAQAFFVAGKAIRIIGVRSTQPAEIAALDRGHLALQAPGGEIIVADEVDRVDADLRAFSHGEDEVDAIVRQLDFAVGNLHRRTAGPIVGLTHAIDIGIEGGLVHRAARLGLHDGRQLVCGDFLVLLEHDAVDDRRRARRDLLPRSGFSRAHQRRCHERPEQRRNRDSREGNAQLQLVHCCCHRV